VGGGDVTGGGQAESRSVGVTRPGLVQSVEALAHQFTETTFPLRIEFADSPAGGRLAGRILNKYVVTERAVIKRTRRTRLGRHLPHRPYAVDRRCDRGVEPLRRRVLLNGIRSRGRAAMRTSLTNLDRLLRGGLAGQRRFVERPVRQAESHRMRSWLTYPRRSAAHS